MKIFFNRVYKESLVSIIVVNLCTDSSSTYLHRQGIRFDMVQNKPIIKVQVVMLYVDYNSSRIVLCQICHFCFVSLSIRMDYSE